MYIRTILYTMVSVGSLVAASATTSDQKVDALVQKINEFQFSVDDFPRNAIVLKHLYGAIGEYGSLLWNIATDEKGDALMHRAVMAQDLVAIRLLSSWGANVNVHNVQGGWTPLHYAAYNRYSTIMDGLLTLGADPDATDKGGLLIGTGILGQEEEMQQRLMQARHETFKQFCTQIPTLRQACIYTLIMHKTDMTSVPIDMQYAATTTQQWLNTKLHMHLLDAAEDHAGITLLLSRGADPNCNQYHVDSISNIMATEMPLLRIVRQFLDHPASRVRSWAIIDTLLKFGAQPDARNVKSLAPDKFALHCCASYGLSYLASNGDPELYRALLARLCVKGVDELKVPVSSGNKNLAELLRCCITSSYHTENAQHHSAFKRTWQEAGMSW